MFKLEDKEIIIKVIRRHYLVMVPMILTLLLLTLLPLFIYVLLVSDFLLLDQNVKMTIETFFSEWKVFGYSLWLLLLWIIFFIEWTDYYLDLWIITDKRIIDVEQKGFFRREVTSFSFGQIQDITVETSGFVETFFKYGTLHIQTAGHNREIIIRDAYLPEEARTLVLRLQEKLKAI